LVVGESRHSRDIGRVAQQVVVEAARLIQPAAEALFAGAA
jgi:hypothetical protein